MTRERLASVAVAVAIAAGLTITVLWSRAPRDTRVHVGALAPDVELAYAEPGPTGHLADFRGAPVLLAFVETVTVDGQGFMQALEKVSRRNAARGLRVVAVAVDGDRQELLGYLRRTTITFAVFHDPFATRVTPAWGTPHPPEAYLIDRDGRVKAVFVTAFGDRDQRLSDALEPLLRPSPDTGAFPRRPR